MYTEILTEEKVNSAMNLPINLNLIWRFDSLILGVVHNNSWAGEAEVVLVGYDFSRCFLTYFRT